MTQIKNLKDANGTNIFPRTHTKAVIDDNGDNIDQILESHMDYIQRTSVQGPQGPKGDTVTATDYTLYNVQGSSSEGAMSQDAITKAISAQTGYYTCSTAAATAEKVVTVESGNLYKLTSGGQVKVKMTYANTAASGVTLQIGSETAKTLMYNGEAVSATNTWDAGEVISVYYDPSANSNAGAYYASNAQGGGGKAEKIKYDIANSGFSSTNVQNVLDEVSGILYEETSVSYGSQITGNIIVAGGSWSGNNDTHSFYAIPVTEGKKFRIVGNASQSSFYAYLYDLTRSASGPVSYATGETGRHSISSNKTVVITIPAGTNYLYICNTNQGTSQLPQSIKKLKVINASIDEIRSDIENIWTELVYEEETDFGTLVTGYVIVSNGSWSAENDTHSFYYKQVREGEVYSIKANAEQTSYYAWLNSVSTSSAPDYAPGYTGRIGIGKGGERELTVPEGANFLYVCNTNLGVSQLPQYIRRVYTVKEITLNNQEEIENMFEDIHSKEEIDLNGLSTRSLIITAFGTWSQSDGFHKLIPINDFKGFKITANNSTQTYYTYLTDDYCVSMQMPHYAEGEIGRRRIGPGVSAFTVPIPSDAAYLYIHISSTSGNYTPAAVYGYTSVSDAVTSNTERISALEGNSGFTHAYQGGKIDLKTYHYDITQWYTSFAYAHQSGACFGDYYFMIQDKYAGMRVVNLATGTILYTGNTGVTGKTATRYHCNQCTFGITYYDESDPFPLLYVTVQEDDVQDLRCSQEVYRVVATYDNETEEFNSFTLVQVQLIWLPPMTSSNCLGNANMVIDKVRNRMVFYSRDDNTTTKWCKITEMNIPGFTPVDGDTLQTVTLEDSNILNSYFIDSAANNMQGGCIYAGKLFIARGSYSAGYIQLIVVDLIKKCQIALLNPYADGVLTSEPEGCFVYNGQVCVSTLTSSATQNNGYFYKFAFE